MQTDWSSEGRSHVRLVPQPTNPLEAFGGGAKEQKDLVHALTSAEYGLSFFYDLVELEAAFELMEMQRERSDVALKSLARINCTLSICDARRLLHANLDRALTQLLITGTTLPPSAFSSSVTADTKRPFPALEQEEFSRGLFQLAAAHSNAP